MAKDLRPVYTAINEADAQERLVEFHAIWGEKYGRDFARSFIADTSTDRLAPDFVDLLVDDVLEVPVVAWKEMFASLLRYDDTAQLPRLSAPVTLIWGDADPLVPKEMQEELLRLLPTAELRTYTDTGHTPRWEQPKRFAGDVATFASQAFS